MTLYESAWAPEIIYSTLMRLQKVQVGNDQEKAQTEKNSQSKLRGGKNYSSARTKGNSKCALLVMFDSD